MLSLLHLTYTCVQDGEYVSFSEVEGMPELNRGKPFKVINCKVAAMPKFHCLLLC